MNIDNKQLKTKCLLCGDRNGKVNHIIREYSKLTQNDYKTRDAWVGKVTYKEFCKRLKLGHVDTKGLQDWEQLGKR